MAGWKAFVFNEKWRNVGVTEGDGRGGYADSGLKPGDRPGSSIGVKISARRDFAAELPVRWDILAGNR